MSFYENQIVSQTIMHSVIQTAVVDPVFDLANDKAYSRWRDVRLGFKTPGLSELQLLIEDPYHLSDTERAAIIDRCDKYNMAIYQLSDPAMQDKSLVHTLGEQLALKNLDANLRSDDDKVSSVEVRSQAGNQYIPYTDKALSWHTDGYYNRLDKQIYAFIMHCVRPAKEGGANSLLNPEIVYIALRDENPAYIEALMHPEAMTIPDNKENGKVIRKVQTGPVFMIKPCIDTSIEKGTGMGASFLHMRFSARKRNIIWRDTEDTAKAVAMIEQLLAEEENIFNITLKAGQGIVCNNVLHNRNRFIDDELQTRLMYRARYYDAVS